jgi:hypothetical protein
MSSLAGGSFARAEFYYSTNMAWEEEVALASMWNLAWRARLRRLDLDTLAGTDLVGVVRAVNDALSMINESVPENSFNEMLDALSAAGTISDKDVERVERGRRAANADNGSNWAFMEFGPIH